MRVLIADDEQVSRMVLERTLQVLGYDVDVARDGQQAWEMFLEHRHPVIIADWVMPGIDGLELCRRIRHAKGDHYSYVILLTSKFEKQDRLTGLSAGADDFVVKPFDRGELAARLGVAERILRMESELLQANRQIQQTRRQEIEIGARIQRALLMARPPDGNLAFEFAAMNLPSSQIDGDFFDFFVHTPEVVDLFVGDAMGKGIPAALVGAGTKSTLLRTIARLLGDRHRETLPAPREIVQTANNSLGRELIQLNSFVTLEYARLDADRMIATFVDCGHTKVLHRSQQAGRTQEVSGENFPIGFVANEVYKEYSVPFAIGDLFCFYSDGVTDARSPDNDYFGSERLRDVVDAYAHDSPTLIIYRLREAVRNHVQDLPLDDDFTVVVVRVGPRRRLDRHGHRFPKSIESLQPIREFIASSLVDHGLSDTEIARLQLAAQEATTNIVYHSDGNESGPIEYLVEPDTTEIRMRILYPGRPFRPSSPGLPDVSRYDEGGYGLFIIQKSVDRVHYGTDTDGRQYIDLTLVREGHLSDA